MYLISFKKKYYLMYYFLNAQRHIFDNIGLKKDGEKRLSVCVRKRQPIISRCMLGHYSDLNPGSTRSFYIRFLIVSNVF